MDFRDFFALHGQRATKAKLGAAGDQPDPITLKQFVEKEIQEID